MRTLWVALASAFLLLLISGCSESRQEVISSQQATGDWRVYSFEELVEQKSDLILIATVEEVSRVHVQDSIRNVQEAFLKPEQLLRGTPVTEKIILYQSVDHVKLDQSYLLFLEYNPSAGRYVVVDANSQLLIENIVDFLDKKDNVHLTYSDVQGEFTIDELIDKLK